MRTGTCGASARSASPSARVRFATERTVRSVANLTRADGVELLALAPAVPLRAEVVRYPLARANEALADLRGGRLRGAAVLLP